jgi:hypothetical protein
MESYRKTAIEVLKQNEFSRNSDWEFLFEFLLAKGVYVPHYLRTEIYTSKLNIRSIMRERQYVQNTMGIYPPTDPQIIANRKERSIKFREHYKGE